MIARKAMILHTFGVQVHPIYSSGLSRNLHSLEYVVEVWGGGSVGSGFGGLGFKFRVGGLHGWRC